MRHFSCSMIIIVAVSLYFCGCTPSLVYSPSLHLPPEPLKKHQFQAVAGVDFLPETRPEPVGKETALGGEATLRYGVSDYFSMQAKGWYDFSENLDIKRYGFSYANIIILNDPQSRLPFGIIPTFAVLFDGGGVEGGGGASLFALWLPAYRSFKPYLAAGPAVGVRNLEESPKQWGWGWIFNSGLGYRLGDRLTLNLEIAAIQQINKYNDTGNFVIAPSVSMGVTL